MHKEERQKSIKYWWGIAIEKRTNRLTEIPFAEIRLTISIIIETKPVAC